MTNTYKSPIDTVVIPVGGYGTRMGEATKAVPKALLPVGDKPLIVHAVDEARASGVRKVIIPCRPDDVDLFRKQFYGHEGRDKVMLQNGRDHLMENRKDTIDIEVVPIYDKEGPASTIAKLVKERDIGAFGVILPDDLMVDSTPVLKQMILSFEKTGMTIVGARLASLDVENPHNVTFVKTQTLDDGTHITNTIQIKPEDESPVSQNATCGRYIFDADFVDVVEGCDKTGLKEVSLSAIVRHYAHDGGVGVTPLNDAKFYDCGDPAGYMRAQAAFMPANILVEAFAKVAETQVIVQFNQSEVSPSEHYIL